MVECLRHLKRERLVLSILIGGHSEGEPGFILFWPFEVDLLLLLLHLNLLLPELIEVPALLLLVVDGEASGSDWGRWKGSTATIGVSSLASTSPISTEESSWTNNHLRKTPCFNWYHSKETTSGSTGFVIGPKG